MITIFNELTVDVGLVNEEVITLWLVSYQDEAECKRHKWATFVEELGDFCLSRGWSLECGDDPNQEHQLTFFDDDEWPDDDDDDLYDLKYWLN